MKNIYIMIVITIVLFVISMDFIFVTNIFIDLLIVLIYLMLVSYLSLKLETSVKEIEGQYILKEKKTAYFAPLIFIYFLSIAFDLGIFMIIVNILVVLLLYGYVYVSITRNKIIVTNETVTAEYLNGKSATMSWQDITEVDFDWIYNLIIFRDDHNNEIKLDVSLQDFLLIINMIKEKLLKKDYEIAFKNYRIFNTIFLRYSNNIHLK